MTDERTITVSVNGEPLRMPEGSTVADLLRTLEAPPAFVAVEHNRRVVPRAEHPSLRLAEGDSLEIVTFVGGG
jgi:thiamine biosynthesis protein ThiS